MMPGLAFAVAIAACSWLVQEHVMPAANLKQDALRGRIKGGEARAITGAGRQWLASTDTHRFYSYEYSEDQQALVDPVVYELDGDAVHLSKIISGKLAVWTGRTEMDVKEAENLMLNGLEVDRQVTPELRIQPVESVEVFRPSIDKPSQLSSAGLRNYLHAAKQRGLEVSALSVALQRKYAEPFSIIIMAFIGMPLAVSFGRKGTVLALCAAVVVGVAYWAVGGGFQQLGNHGLLRPSVAGWSPLLIFGAAGTYFLSRVKT
jgi:lipopolysaccharide export LptBFGC system permease protein LptF